MIPRPPEDDPNTMSIITRLITALPPEPGCPGSLRGMRAAAGALLLSAALPAPAQEHHPGENAHPHDDDATVHHRFEGAETWAARFEDPERDGWQLPGRVVETLITRDDMVVVDIGSATGYFPVRFARACPEGMVYGADVEPDMVFYLNDRARTEGLHNLVSILAAPGDPHLPRPVDLVFLCNTYHHIDDRIDYFRRLRDRLLPGGKVAVVDYRVSSERGPPHKLPVDALRREMQEAGYAIAQEHDFLPEQYFLVFSPAED